MANIIVSSMKKNRFAFTLVELLVVIAIMAILATVGASVVMRFLGSQKNNATENTVKLLQTALDRVVNNIHRRSQQDFNLLPSNQKTILDGLAINLGTNLGVREPARRQMVVYQNIQLFRNFPKTLAEININKVTMPANYPSTFDFAATIQKKFYEIKNTEGGVFAQLSPEEANSALLLLALESNPDGLKREDLAGALTFKAKVPFIANSSGDPIQFSFKFNLDPSANATALKGAYSIEFIY